MLSFSFSRISFTKAAKYVFLISTQQQTKRTDVCFLLTSSPTFDQTIDFYDNQMTDFFKIKACQATIDRKLKIIGTCIVQSQNFIYQKVNLPQNLIFDRDLQLKQTVQGKEIPVGRFHLQIRRKQSNQKLTQKLTASKAENTKQIKIPQKDERGIKSMSVSAVYPKNDSMVKEPVNSARLPQKNKFSVSQAINVSKDSPKKDFSNSKKINKNQKDYDDDFDSDMQIKQPQTQEAQNNCSIRFFIHGGTNFYLGSAFSIQLVWGQKYCQTRYIQDKINPQWAQTLTLLGSQQQYVIVNIVDERKNILEWTKFSLKNIRKIYPYHLKIIFREEYMGDRPVVYLSMLREDLPKFSILDKQIQLVVSCDDDNVRNPLKYLIIQSKTEFQMPHFYQIDLRKFGSFEQVNKFIEGFQVGDYNWKLFMPLQTGKKALTMFKSQLSKDLNLFMISIKNWLQLFAKDHNFSKRPLTSSTAIDIVQSRPSFHNILKQIYYHQQVHRLGKFTQIYGESSLREGQINDTNTWRTMTKNYILRNQLFNGSVKNIETLRKHITSKGQQLVKLKKILKQVKQINTTLKQKQKSALSSTMPRSRSKQRLSAQNIKITDIELMLYEKQSQLQFKKKRNQQMTQRMESLNIMEEDTTQLDNQVVKNAKILLEQQQKIKLLMLMRRQLPKQKQLISKLQKIFQKNQLDREMNKLLQSQQEKLNKIRIKKRQDLQNVYNLLKQKNAKQDTLQSKIERAQQELVRLNQAYAKLTGL